MSIDMVYGITTATHRIRIWWRLESLDRLWTSVLVRSRRGVYFLGGLSGLAVTLIKYSATTIMSNHTSICIH